MIDKDDVNIWEGIGTTIGIGAFIMLFAIGVYTMGFFQTTMWSIVVGAIIGIIIKLKENV